MKIYLAKIAAAPWHVEVRDPINGMDGISVYSRITDTSPSPWIADFGIDPERLSNAEFTALARNAFDVLMRRKTWVPMYSGGSWSVIDTRTMSLAVTAGLGVLEHMADDPFTAIVNADEWVSWSDVK